VKKKLCQVRIHHKRIQSYVRNPDADLDCIFELSSTVTHEAGTPTFNELLPLIFVSHQATDLLIQEPSDILCNFKLVKSDVKLIQLKIVTGEYQRENTDEPNVQFLYRTVKIISLQDQKEGSTHTKETIEFCASPIIKRESLLRLACQMGLALTTNEQQQYQSELSTPKSSNKKTSAKNIVISEIEYTPKMGEISRLTLIPTKTLKHFTKTSSKSYY